MQPSPELEQHLEKYGVVTRDPASEQYFSAIVNIAINEYHISVKDIAEKCSCSFPTVERWAKGISAPAVQMRPFVLEWLVERM